MEGQNASLEVRAEEAEGNLAAAQAEAERASTELDKGMKHLSAKHSEKIAVLEASLRSEVRAICSIQRRLRDLDEGISIFTLLTPFIKRLSVKVSELEYFFLISHSCLIG